MRKKNIIKIMESLALKAEDSELKEAFYEAAAEDMTYISEFLGISNQQALIFTLIFSLNIKNTVVDLNDIARYLKCNHICMLSVLAEDIPFLIGKELLMNHNSGSKGRIRFENRLSENRFYVPDLVCDRIIRNQKPQKLSQKRKMTLTELLEEYAYYYKKGDDGDISEAELLMEIDNLCEENRSLPFIKKLNMLSLDGDDKLFFLYLCSYVFKEDNDFYLNSSLNSVFKRLSKVLKMKKSIVRKHSQLITKNLLEIEDGFFRNDKSIRISDHGLDILLGEDKDMMENVKNKENKMLNIITNIEEKTLFFDIEDEKRLGRIRDILHEDNLLKVNQRMQEQKLRNAMTILFYGPPGTGKTESVLQLARQTGREVLLVEISQTKSMWFGESEKRIKDVFRNYHDKLERSKVAPIMLFNEADAIFSKRMDAARSAVGQTENAMQNIILQEMETFNGILIATTNMTFNLDAAFERRFLFKVEFKQPSVEVRAKIWQQKLRLLSEDDASFLADNYQFSGGQIENIVRKAVMHHVLNGKYPSLIEIDEFCREELLSKKSGTIGFRCA